MPAHVPYYDPAVDLPHVGEDAPVRFVEMYCECGGVWRQRDPVSHIEPQVADWYRRHTGPGHGPTSKAVVAEAREEASRARWEERQDALEATAETKGEDFERAPYVPREFPNLDTDDEKFVPWPELTPRLAELADRQAREQAAAAGSTVAATIGSEAEALRQAIAAALSERRGEG